MNDEDKTKGRTSGESIGGGVWMDEGLPESELEYRRLLEALPVGIANTTPDGKVLYHNAYARGLLGYEPAELEHLRAEDFYIDPGDREDLIRHLQEKGMHSFEYRQRRKDGQTIPKPCLRGKKCGRQ